MPIVMPTQKAKANKHFEVANQFICSFSFGQLDLVATLKADSKRHNGTDHRAAANDLQVNEKINHRRSGASDGYPSALVRGPDSPIHSIADAAMPAAPPSVASASRSPQ
jgi:hypothetical protein